MVYPPLEAAAPPPLVQSFSAPVLTSDASISPSLKAPTLKVPAQKAISPKPLSPSPASAVAQSVQEGLQDSTTASAAVLGTPVSIPPAAEKASVRFTFSPLDALSGSKALGLQAFESHFFESQSKGLSFSTSSPPSFSSQTLNAQKFSFQTLEASVAKPPRRQQAQQPAPLPSVTPSISPKPNLAPDLPSEPAIAPQNPAVPQPRQPETASPSPASQSFVELSADRQEYETLERSVTAIGNVLLNYRNAQLRADRVRTLALTKQVFAEGNIRLTLGEQVLEGDRLEYQLDQERGVLFKPRGIINLPSTGRDFSTQTPGTNATGSNPLTPLSETLQRSPNPEGTAPESTAPGGTAPEGATSNITTLEAKAGLQRLRFEADRIEFAANSWKATNIRITSDPFSPPELELRANQAQLTRISAQEDLVTLQRPRLVFDQNISIPIPRSKIGLSRQRQNPFAVDIGFDDRDRGGLYLGSTFTPISNPKFSLAITPQIFLQRALLDRDFGFLSPDVYGLNVAIRSTFSPKTSLGAFVALRSLDLTKLNDTTRAGLRLTQQLKNDYRLDFEAAYRERVLNGSLEEQNIQNRVGAILIAPTQQIGKTGIQLDYRVAAELFTAQTDSFGGLSNVTLGRVQGSASLQKAFDLWQGTTLPPTATEGLKYTPEPIRPYFRIVVGATGVFSAYSNSDTQTSLIGKIRFEGQFGHFSKPYLDYTGFFVGFSQGLQLGESPFLFDRVVDRQTVSFGFLQQVYGPIRLGFQTSINLDTGEFFNTDIILDYSRRTYGLSLRYNPNLQLGAIEFRINSFNWVSNRNPLSAPEVGVVEAGVGQSNDPF
ncbi:MAG: DUF3769 domain-containing protein [Thermosynechococcaceae cyanobacterium MS004]|nr:DUF3769 domain-containing protein [Thermosynechococcaceae cyanobacterium MS004]